jgi:hypothetical protein
MLSPTLCRTSFVAAFAFCAAGLVAACGGSDGSNVSGGNGNGGPNTGAGAQPSLDPNATGATGSGTDEHTITPDEACAEGSGTADAIPAVVQMVVDTSGSMDWVPGTEMRAGRGQQSKWDITSQALKDAVAKLPSSVAVGLNFYPNTRDDMPCINNRIALKIALLGNANSTQRTNFDRAVDAAGPQGGTPTHAAYRFGEKAVADSPLTGQKFVLLITDGIPTRTLTCEGDGMTAVDSQPLIDEVGMDLAMHGVKTFVIGSPGSEDARTDLSKMATAGGTATAGCSDSGPTYCHLDMTTAKDFAAALAAGLAQIAGQISTCEFAIPPAPPGKTLDPKRVNVLYTHGDGTQSSILHDGTDMCAAGWKYDDDTAPTKITLCGADCDAVKADQGAKVDVIFGCSTEDVPVK